MRVRRLVRETETARSLLSFRTVLIGLRKILTSYVSLQENSATWF